VSVDAGGRNGSRRRFRLAIVVLVMSLGGGCDRFLQVEQKTIPRLSERACLDRGGRWGSPGIPGNDRAATCDLPSPDAGSSCTDSSQCDGYCLHETADPLWHWFRSGQCSPWHALAGCNGVVEEGTVIQLCVD
jgi:hypothetical protein